ncbi:peptide/nickel transport system substrate-binding protein [Humitalea rosea]|uniref:Peptide/nickel transport system substrate-binding protein n=2 Tax=Humitalea rosea TaxID=990373 RepID=A0A2W7ICT7_9PROT|nr:peptide/nickel transport system substrate-binding protein [Humitalea rosea]
MHKLRLLAVIALATGWAFGAAAQGTLRIGINEDPDALDPATNRLASGRQPLTAICDKLFDVSTDLDLVPQLAESYVVAPDGMSVTLKLRPGVTFHDGEPMNAEAVRFTLERNVTRTGSLRRSELTALDHAEVVDPLTLRLVLKEPQSSLLLINLAERAGMIVSPKASEALGDRFGTAPVCAGPYRFVERVPQGRIVVERYANYWDRAMQGPDRIEYMPITDSTVRISALRSGELQIAERLTPTDLPQLDADPNVNVVSAPDLGYHVIRLNTNNGPHGALLGRDVRIRQAINLAIDRNAMVHALFEDKYTAGNQFVNPSNPNYDTSHPVPERDVAASRRLLRAAGVPNLTFTLLVPPERERQEAAQFIQAMLSEAGITMNLETQENATMLQNGRRGQFEALFTFWSGRPHPDGNVFTHYSCTGPQNDSKYCNAALDEILVKARQTDDAAERQRLYRSANAILAEELPSLILWHRRTFTGVSTRVRGFVPHPDSTIRVRGITLQ